MCRFPPPCLLAWGGCWIAGKRWRPAGWQNQTTWVLYLDDQPIDLVSFGALDFEADGLMFRMWNVVIKNIQPGPHSLRYTFTENGVNYDATWEFNVIDG